MLDRLKAAAGKLQRRSKRRLRRMGVPVDARDRSLRRLRNVHKGRRAFIVANGPSMKPEYFALLEGEVCFAFNSMYKVLPKHRWRPTYLMVHDRVIGPEIAADLQASLDPTVQLLVGDELCPHYTDDGRTTFYKVAHFTAPGQQPGFSPHPLMGLHAGSSVVYAALQLAWYMGIRELYLLGVDLKYSVTEQQQVGAHHQHRVITGDFKGSYFDPSMDPGKALRMAPDTAGMLLALQSAAAFYGAHGGAIYNAAPDSPLELFPRRPIQELLAGKG